jgi:hypothetical protein
MLSIAIIIIVNRTTNMAKFVEIYIDLVNFLIYDTYASE